MLLKQVHINVSQICRIFLSAANADIHIFSPQTHTHTLNHAHLQRAVTGVSRGGWGNGLVKNHFMVYRAEERQRGERANQAEKSDTEERERAHTHTQTDTHVCAENGAHLSLSPFTRPSNLSIKQTTPWFQ